jgi:hypothetical protein
MSASYNTGMGVTYYRIRGRGIRVGEYRRLCTDPFSFVIAVLILPFGGIAPAWSVPLPDRIPDVDPRDLPKGVARTLDRHAARFEEEGYRPLFTYEVPLLERDRLTAASILLSRDGWSMAQVLYIKNGEQTQVGLTVGCWCEDGTHATVTNRKLELDPVPGHRTERYVGATAGDLVDRFLDHAADWDAEGMKAVKLDDAGVRRMLLTAEREAVEHYADRGVLVRMTAKELAKYGIEE